MFYYRFSAYFNIYELSAIRIYCSITEIKKIENMQDYINQQIKFLLTFNILLLPNVLEEIKV